MSDDDGIYRVETVPPPDGESDAYNAPTRIGPMASALVEEMLAQGRREAADAAEPKAPSEPKTRAAEEVDAAALLNAETLTARLEAAEAERKTAPPVAPAATTITTPPESIPASVEPAVLSTKTAEAAAKATADETGASRNNLLLFLLVVVFGAIGFYLLRR